MFAGVFSCNQILGQQLGVALVWSVRWVVTPEAVDERLKSCCILSCSRLGYYPSLVI
jgi:hypothetical protein